MSSQNTDQICNDLAGAFYAAINPELRRISIRHITCESARDPLFRRNVMRFAAHISLPLDVDPYDIRSAVRHTELPDYAAWGGTLTYQIGNFAADIGSCNFGPVKPAKVAPPMSTADYLNVYSPKYPLW